MSTPDVNAPAPGGEGTGANPPVPTPAPADAAPAAPQAAPEGETVIVKKTDYEAMKGRQSALDKKEERLARREKALARGGSFNFGKTPDTPAPAAAAPSGDEADGSAEDRKAERGLLNLALKPEYRAALDASPDFRDLLTKNPLALLPVYASDAFDAEDAISLITEELERRAAATKAAAPAAPAAPAVVEVPPAGVVNLSDGSVATEGMKDQEYKDVTKGGTVKGIAAGIKHRLQSVGKRK